MTLDPRHPVRIFLSQQPWFHDLEATTQHELVHAMLLQRAARGELLVRRGTEVVAWWAVLAGMAKLQTEGPHGRVSAFLGVPAGEWFGEGTVLKGGPWRYDVVAVRDTTLVGMPLAWFRRLHATHLPFNHFLIDRLNERLGQAMTAIEAGRLRTPQERVAQILLMFCSAGVPRITLSQEDLGHLAGLSRQTINRVLKQFEARGWVTLDFSRVEVCCSASLHALLRHPGTLTPPTPAPTTAP
ncbi:MAG: Crp/Fnr family transcriptional regulator [Tepidimonas ignava]|uniref:CRP-like cAMP-activated global transcriptional regulator n=1 Tax=Tepidimonas ignava TaxID=114249 RepID=A0A4R3LNE1_9BURK|nr:Crp/Fnr family transcriptional regulator [Tepidimonas ignava]TCS99456.1 Crp/Fnr family transcriptional regulator [Tepidimonas ignava]TSE21956.1 CRP-like cAMP-activated global transcriptional regulator [Tepidimonas ignava]